MLEHDFSYVLAYLFNQLHKGRRGGIIKFKKSPELRIEPFFGKNQITSARKRLQSLLGPTQTLKSLYNETSNKINIFLPPFKRENTIIETYYQFNGFSVTVFSVQWYHLASLVRAQSKSRSDIYFASWHPVNNRSAASRVL